VKEREAVVSGPAENLVPGDGAAVRTAEAEGVEPGEDAVATDERELLVGELRVEEIIDRALLLGGKSAMAGAFASVVAGPMPAGAPGSGLPGGESAGEEASVDGGLWGVECLGDVREGLAGFVAADGISEIPAHGHEEVFALRLYQPSARRVYQPAALP
jgi:hypothetical protein